MKNKFSLLRKENSITYKDKVYKFKNPTIETFLIAQEKLESGELKSFKEVIELYIPNIKISNVESVLYGPDIIKSIYEEIMPSGGEKQAQSGDEGFFPSTIDYLCPDASRQIDYIKNTSLNQMFAQAAAKERNINIKNGDKHKNRNILLRQVDRDDIEAAKERIRLKFNAK